MAIVDIEVRERMQAVVKRLLREVHATLVYAVRNDGRVLVSEVESSKLTDAFRVKLVPKSLVIDSRNRNANFLDAALELEDHDIHTLQVNSRAALVVVVHRDQRVELLGLRGRKAADQLAALIGESESAGFVPPTSGEGEGGSGAPGMIGLAVGKRRGVA